MEEINATGATKPISTSDATLLIVIDLLSEPLNLSARSRFFLEQPGLHEPPHKV